MRLHMLPKFFLTALLLVALASGAAACGSNTPAQTYAPAATVPPAQPATVETSATPMPTQNVQATVDAAIAATAQVQRVAQATIDAAVVATVGALPPTATPVPTVSTLTLTEEEMETMIAQAVDEAVAATTAATTAATQATADDMLTAEEAQAVQIYTQGAEQALAYAEELLDGYAHIYYDLAYEALDEVYQIEQEISMMAMSIYGLNEAMTMVNETLQTGQELATETVDQVESAAQQIQSGLSGLTQAQATVDVFQEQAQLSRDTLTQQLAALQPSAGAPQDLQTTLQTAFSFVDEVRGVLGDEVIDRNELMQLGQLGVDLQAGFSRHGGAQFSDLSGKVGEITQQLARGQLPKARDGVNQFEGKLGQRPGPGGGGGGLPGLPTPGGLRPKP